nr:PEGA domain-containing protein [uncultured Methanolobus sp.]
MLMKNIPQGQHIILITLLLSLTLAISPASAFFSQIETVDDSGDAGEYTSLAYDPAGNPAIVYFDSTDVTLKYAYLCDGKWTIQTVDNNGFSGIDSSLDIDNNGNAGISYFDKVNGNLRFAHSIGGYWNTEIVDHIGDVGGYTSFAFDQSGCPGIAYYDSINNGMKYAYKNGNVWTIKTIDSGYVGLDTSIDFYSPGYPGISYFDSTNFDLKYAYYDGSKWNIQVVDSEGLVGEYNSLKLYKSKYPGISYYDSSNGDLKYAYKNESKWIVQKVDTQGNVGLETSVDFDNAGFPGISYYDYSNGDLKYACYDGVAWNVRTVDIGEETGGESTGGEDTGRYSSLEFDPSDNVGISYYDVTNTSLKYAYISRMSTLNINSSVAGAWVYVDGLNMSIQTNTTLKLKDGIYHITVMKDGYDTPVNRKVVINSSMTLVNEQCSVLEFEPVHLSYIHGLGSIPISGIAPMKLDIPYLAAENHSIWNLSFGDESWISIKEKAGIGSEKNMTEEDSSVNTPGFSFSLGSLSLVLFILIHGKK